MPFKGFLLTPSFCVRLGDGLHQVLVSTVLIQVDGRVVRQTETYKTRWSKHIYVLVSASVGACLHVCPLINTLTTTCILTDYIPHGVTNKDHIHGIY